MKLRIATGGQSRDQLQIEALDFEGAARVTVFVSGKIENSAFTESLPSEYEVFLNSSCWLSNTPMSGVSSCGQFASAANTPDTPGIAGSKLDPLDSSFNATLQSCVRLRVSSLRRFLYAIARLLGDINAVQKGRIGRKLGVVLPAR